MHIDSLNLKKIFIGSSEIKRAYIGEVLFFDKDEKLSLPYLTFSSGDFFTLETGDNQKHWNGELEYSTDAINWQNWSGTVVRSGFARETSEYVLYVRGIGNTVITGESDVPDISQKRWKISCSSHVNCSGNIEALLDYPSVVKGKSPLMGEDCFGYLFQNNTKLKTAPELPSQTLQARCYHAMFEGCSSLLRAPELPAERLVDCCYEYMFLNCKNLEQAPELSASILVPSCYESMFAGCEALREPPVLSVNNLRLANRCYYNMFSGCINLEYAPILSSINLSEECYYGMFSGCRKIVTAPDLSSMTGVAKECCAYMFSGCTNLTVAPSSLPATVLAEGCYNAMFSDCESLQSVSFSFINIETLAKECFKNMFSGCDLLTQAPVLPGSLIPLAEGCYQGMFQYCSSLTTPPVLAAKTLAKSCYASMFQGCSLTVTPGLPAETLAESCYEEMFVDCPSITTPAPLRAPVLKTKCYKRMFADCRRIRITPTGIGETYRIPSTEEGEVEVGAENCLTEMFDGTTGGSGGSVVTPSLNTNYYILGITDYPCITFSATSLFNLEVYNNLKGWDEGGIIEYSTDKVNWNIWNGTRISSNISNGTHKLYLRGLGNSHIIGYQSTSGSVSPDVSYRWKLSGAPEISCSGNIETLLDCIKVYNGEHPPMAEHCFSCLFKDNDRLISSPELPAQTLASHCYFEMFAGCSNLLTAPALRATQLTKGCYQSMFYGCTSLTTPPDLSHVTTLASYCYSMMFYHSGLTIAPSLPVRELQSHCYDAMFMHCTALTTPPVLNADILSDSCYSSMFFGCTSLTSAPDLPAENLEKDCYMSMFQRCRALVNPPVISATSLGYRCYYNMFAECSHLTSTPSLGIESLTEGCYYGMFQGCSDLTSVPSVLPARTLASGCYMYMFNGCRSLISAPALPVDDLRGADKCYLGMFMDCRSLTSTPSLSAELLSDECYSAMFSGCISLTTCPDLPAANLTTSCYEEMFSGCTGLITLPSLKAQTLTENCYNRMFYGCSGIMISTQQTGMYQRQYRIPTTGNIISQEINSLTNMFTGTTPDVPANAVTTPQTETIYYTNGIIYDNNYITFSSPDEFTIEVADHQKHWNQNGTIEFSSGDIWRTWDGTTVLRSAIDNGSYKIYIRGLGNTYITGDSSYIFENPGAWLVYNTALLSPHSVSISGNFENLLDYEQVKVGQHPNIDNYCFKGMFSHGSHGLDIIDVSGISLPDPAQGLTEECYCSMFSYCHYLTVAPALPMTRLAKGCYEFMFYNCSSLTTAPALPATVLAEDCYYSMFSGCSSLITVPAFPLTVPDLTNAKGCYRWMFASCRSLVIAPALPATQLAPSSSLSSGCYSHMFFGCTALTTPPDLSHITQLTYGCCWNMFADCTSLTTAPALPVTTLAGGCYDKMFSGCTSLIIPPILSSTQLADYCYEEMFSGCTALTTAPALPATQLAPGCYWGMFSGCTALTTAPILPSTQLAYTCYYEMFKGCSSLTEAPVLPATTLFQYCYYGMFEGCSSLTQIPFLPALDLQPHCYQEMFKNCTSLLINDTQQSGVYQIEYSIPMHGQGTDATDALLDMFAGTGGSFTGTPNINSVYYVDYPQAQNPDKPYLKISSPQSFSLNVVDYTKYWDSTIEWSNTGDNNTWATWDGTTILLSNSERRGTDHHLYLRGTGNHHITGSQQTSSVATWVLTGTSLIIEGNFESLLDYSTVTQGTYNIMDVSCYKGLFRNNTGIIAVPYRFLTTNLSDSCYSEMFYGCSSLKFAPKLPATTLQNECYSGMFYGCQSLKVSPKLLSQTHSTGCYSWMFRDCTLLEQGPMEILGSSMPAYGCYNMFKNCGLLSNTINLRPTIIGAYGYAFMFDGCVSLPQTNFISGLSSLGAYSCQAMFQNCASLTFTPQLSITSGAVTLGSYCCSYMFNGCSGLTTIQSFFTSNTQNRCYQYMFQGCSSLTTPPRLIGQLESYCYEGMFKDCTNLNALPELAEQNLYQGCYKEMFNGCSAIKISKTNAHYSTRYSIPIAGSGTYVSGYHEQLDNMFTGTTSDSAVNAVTTPEKDTNYYIDNNIIFN